METQFLRRSWLLIFLACCLPAAQADEASKTAIINELFAVTHVDTLMQQTERQALILQKSRFERSEPFKSNQAATDELVDRMAQLLNDKLSWEKLKPAMTKLYADNFTEEELAATLTFYKTPAGQAMLTKLPTVMTSAMSITQQQMGDLTPEVTRIVKEVVAKYQRPEGTPADQ